MNLAMEVMLGIVVVIAVVDTWLLVKRGYQATMSATLYAFSRKYIIIPYLMGVVTGHLEWPNESACKLIGMVKWRLFGT